MSDETTALEEKLEHFQRQSEKLSGEVADLEERKASVSSSAAHEFSEVLYHGLRDVRADLIRLSWTGVFVAA